MTAPVVIAVTDASAADVHPLREQLLPLLQRNATVVLDLRRLTYLGPPATRLLLEAHIAAGRAGARLILWGVSGQPLRVLYAVRLDRVLQRRSKHWRPNRAPRKAAAKPATPASVA